MSKNGEKLSKCSPTEGNRKRFGYKMQNANELDEMPLEIRCWKSNARECMNVTRSCVDKQLDDDTVP